MSEWIKCSERMPDKPGEYLVYLPNLKLWNGIIRVNWDGENFEIEDHSCEVTHWMEFPEPPH